MSESRIRRGYTQKLLAICGVIGPVVWAIGWIIAGFLRPGYNHIVQQGSELGEVGTPSAIVWNVSDISFGLLVVAFALGLYQGISGGKRSKVGPALVAGWGITHTISGVAHCDPGCVAVSLTGWIHNAGGQLGVLSMVIGLVLLSHRLKKDPEWKSYSLYSLATGS